MHSFLKLAFVYVCCCVQAVNAGFDAMWESHNKGKLYKHMTIPVPEE